MKVVEVIPVVKGITRPTLSYFTREKFEPGSFVRIPLRKGFAYGIVATSIDARKAKASVKGASFQMRKLSVIERAGKLSDAFMKAADSTAKYYSTTLGSVLSTLLPKLLLEHPELIKKPYKETPVSPREVKLVQLGKDERFREYRSIVRESFARGQSVLFIAPSRDEALRASDSLSIGIERYVFTAVQKSPKVLGKIMADAQAEKHPILFITTQSWVSFDRKDLCTFILEKENSRGYRTLARPYINLKTFLEYYAKAKGATLVLGDSLLSIESLWHEREGRYSEFAPLTWRLKTRCEAEVVDMRAKKEFDVFSPRLTEAVQRSIALGKNVFIYAARKGHSSTTVCGDCAALLLCKNCKAPMVLHEGPVYICHHCGAKRSAETRCDHCQSWKLNPLGIGIDRIAEEAKKVFEGTQVFVLDKDKAPSSAKAKSIVKRFNESEGSILVGTELALSYLEDVPTVAICSLDSLFSIPDFYINERIFYLVTRLRETAEERFIIQTRNAGEEILEYAAAGNILDFYRSEIRDREELRYPPFSVFVKVMTEGSKVEIDKKAANLMHLFTEFDPHFIVESHGQREKVKLAMVMRFGGSAWPDATASEKLLLLTPDFTVKVDPESIL
jgi:primosomal protein N'